MTIDEAIKHQRDMAEKYKYQLVLNETGHPMYALGDREIPRIKQYVEEYTQVAEWLEELKRYKDISSRFNKLVNDIPVYSEQLKERDNDTMVACLNDLVGETHYWAKQSAWSLAEHDNQIRADVLDEVKQKLMDNGFIWTVHGLAVWNDISNKLKENNNESM